MEIKALIKEAEVYYIDNIFCDGITKFEHDIAIRCYTAGAKWQQERMYSEEDMKKAFEDGKEDIDYSQVCGFVSKLTTEEWFEKFKKK